MTTFAASGVRSARSVTLAAALFLQGVIACASPTDEGTPLKPINSTSLARFVAKDIAALMLQVRGSLNNGSYSGRSVSGTSGSASVTGTVSYVSGASCGTSCVESANNTSLTIVLNDYVGNGASNTSTTLSGTVTYTDTRFTRQSGSTFSSGGTMCIHNSGSVTYRLVGDAGKSTEFGYADLITTLNTCGSETTQAGTLATSSGSFQY